MHIEKRGDTEYLIGAPADVNDCTAMRGSRTCCIHFDGHHLSTNGRGVDGASLIVVRWPIEAATAQRDSYALGIVEGLRRVESMMRDLDARHALSAERKLELLAESVSAEFTDVNEAIVERCVVEPVRGER